MFETTNQVYENGWMIQVFFEVSSLSPCWDVALLPSDQVTLLLREQKWIGFFQVLIKLHLPCSSNSLCSITKGAPFSYLFFLCLGHGTTGVIGFTCAAPASHCAQNECRKAWDAEDGKPAGKPGNGSGLIFLDLMPLGFGRPVMVAKTGIVTVAYHMVKGSWSWA